VTILPSAEQLSRSRNAQQGLVFAVLPRLAWQNKFWLRFTFYNSSCKPKEFGATNLDQFFVQGKTHGNNAILYPTISHNKARWNILLEIRECFVRLVIVGSNLYVVSCIVLFIIL
jgi:hypothetical protein